MEYNNNAFYNYYYVTKITQRAAAADLSNLVNCPHDIIREFALLATSRDAFGDPSGWTAIQVGTIMNGT